MDRPAETMNLRTRQFGGGKKRKAEQIPMESCAPRLTSQEVALLHTIWLQLRNEITPEEIDYHDVVEFALEQVRTKLGHADREDVLLRLRFHLLEMRGGYFSPP